MTEDSDKSILTRDRKGEIILLDDPDYPVLLKIIHNEIHTRPKLNNMLSPK